MFPGYRVFAACWLAVLIVDKGTYLTKNFMVCRFLRQSGKADGDQRSAYWFFHCYNLCCQKY